MLIQAIDNEMLFAIPPVRPFFSTVQRTPFQVLRLKNNNNNQFLKSFLVSLFFNFSISAGPFPFWIWHVLPNYVDNKYSKKKKNWRKRNLESINGVSTLVYEFYFYLLFALVSCAPTKVRQPPNVTTEKVLEGLNKNLLPFGQNCGTDQSPILI